MKDKAAPFFKTVKALPNYQLEIETGTGSTILFDFNSRLQTVRFGELRDKDLFESVKTDGDSLVFKIPGKMGITIESATFLDLLAVDRTKL